MYSLHFPCNVQTRVTEMGCPYHDKGDDDSDEAAPERGASESGGQGIRGRDGGLDRRTFVKSALLIGGSGGLSGLTETLGLTPAARSPPDEGPGGGHTGAERIGRAARQNRQHAWDAHEATVATGNTAQPAGSLLLRLDYTGTGEPSPGHRRQVESALREIERHFAWGAGGVLFTMGYSASYFDRFDAAPPTGAAPWSADRVVEASSTLTPYDPEPDTGDAVLLLSSDNPANLLAVEAALWNDQGPDVPDFDATFRGVFEQPTTWPDRRVGEAGPEFQNTEATYEEFLGDDVTEDIPDEAPLSMGFIAGFGDSIPHEDAVTLTRGQRFPGPGIDESAVPTDLTYVGPVGERDPGVFAQGTLKHLSYLTIDLDSWYGNDRDRRRHQMYSPYHDADETTSNDEKPGNELTTGERGDGPGTDSLVPRSTGDEDDEVVYGDTVPETATAGSEETGGTPTAAHSQKSSRARYDLDDDGEVEQPCLRRDWDGIRPNTDAYSRQSGYHFNVPMRFNESIFTLLDATYGPEFRSLDGRIDHTDIDAAAETTADGERNGIVPFMEATRRNNWLVPPITLRALPHPRADSVDVTVNTDSDFHYVVVTGDDGRPIDPDTVAVGTPEQVNKARGVTPTMSTRDDDGRQVFLFDESALDPANGQTLKLFGKRAGSMRPVTAETER